MSCRSRRHCCCLERVSLLLALLADGLNATDGSVFGMKKPASAGFFCGYKLAMRVRLACRQRKTMIVSALARLKNREHLPGGGIWLLDQGSNLGPAD